MLRRRLMKSGVDYSRMYLTFEAIESGTFKATEATQYSLDGGATWVNLSADSSSPTISSGSKIMFKATADASYIDFTGTAQHNVMGNPYSVIYGDNFKGVTSLSSEYALCELFSYNDTLVNAENLSLPATTLTRCCYSEMFRGCTSLTTVPKLPATRLAEGCYSEMFEDCTSLTTAPELPATSLSTGCYSDMFYYCTSLTTAPKLPATSLSTGCYSSMFWGCTSLTTAPELPATWLPTDCYRDMFCDCSSLNYVKAMFTTNPSNRNYTSDWLKNVSSTGTFVKNTAATWNVSGPHGVPYGWNIVYHEYV
jgi:hypothetical protein